MDLTVSPVTAEHWPALEDLFGRAGASNGCWCMYWRIGPRYRDRPREENRRDLERLARSGQPTGLLALDGGTAVGWCELAPRADLDWLARGRYFRPVDELPVPRSRSGAVGARPILHDPSRRVASRCRPVRNQTAAGRLIHHRCSPYPAIRGDHHVAGRLSVPGAEDRPATRTVLSRRANPAA